MNKVVSNHAFSIVLQSTESHYPKRLEGFTHYHEVRFGLTVQNCIAVLNIKWFSFFSNQIKLGSFGAEQENSYFLKRPQKG